MEEFTKEVIAAIQSIPSGKVATYGQIAAIAGNPRGARQVSRILHSMSDRYNLPWHRVINKAGKIVVSHPETKQLQSAKLQAEGVHVNENFKVDLDIYQWLGE